MLRRSILELSARRSLRRIPRLITSQRVPSPYGSFGKDFSTSTPQKGKPPQSKSNLPQVLLGSAVVAGAALLAYRSGYLDQYTGKEQHGYVNSDKVDVDRQHVKRSQPLGEQTVANISEDPGKLGHDVELAAENVETRVDLPNVEVDRKVETQTDLIGVQPEQKVETHVDVPPVEAVQRVEAQADHPPHDSLSGVQSEKQRKVQEVSEAPTRDENLAVKEEKELDSSQGTKFEGSIATESTESKTTSEPFGRIQFTEVQAQPAMVSQNDEVNTVKPKHVVTEDQSEVAHGKVEVVNLLDAYHLKERTEESTFTEGLEEQALANAVEKLSDGYITKDGQLVMNFLHAIHEAEKRQAELDARAFAEEKKALKEKYEKEIRDSRARELMLAEEAAILDKEIKREKAKAAAAIRALQEKMEEKLRSELEQKENEAETKLKAIQELAKAEKDAAIAKEKASQVEKMAEANLDIYALCMAFFAQSQEAREVHSVHKLALGALALEDALSKGLPIEHELDALKSYLETDKDSLLDLVLSTLPEETRHHGTDTLLQLKQKFNGLKGNLRHYILIPPGGSGLLAHTLSQIASSLRFKEVDPSGEGIESIISRVESLLAEGKLAEAADALQEGVRGSQAEEIIGDWVRRARNRAITEQALTVIQSYATSISLTH